jgi:hypothetical protein
MEEEAAAMTDPILLVVVIFLTAAGIAGLVIYLLSPAREKFLNEDAPVNDSRISGQWAGGDDTPTHHLSSPQHNVIHHDFGGHSGGVDGGGPAH